MSDVSGEWWALTLVDGWEAEVNDHCVTITHPDGVGAVQVSAYQKPGVTLSRDDVLEATELEPNMLKHLGEQTWGDFQGFQLVHARGDIFWRRWWLANGSVLLFVTYNCDKQDQDQELRPVNDMLASLSDFHKLGAKRAATMKPPPNSGLQQTWRSLTLAPRS